MGYIHSSGSFTVKSLYASMTADVGIKDFPHNFVWQKEVPPKINFLVWCAVHDRLNTLDMLQHKGLDIYSSCILCGNLPKSQNHLFIHCKVAYKIWCSIMPKKWPWVFPESVFMATSSTFCFRPSCLESNPCGSILGDLEITQ